MNGLLVAIIYSLLFQVGEVTPPNLGGPGFSNLPGSGLPSTGPVLPSQPLGNYSPQKPEIGWKVDPADGKISMIVQIDPAMISEFGTGARGQEMPVDVPPELQGRVQKIIFRVGTSLPERMTLPSISANRNNAQPPFMADLKNNSTFDNRTPVTLEPGNPSEVLNTRGTNSALPNLGGPLATVPNPNPNTLPPAGHLAQSNESQPVLPNTPAFPNDTLRNNRDLSGLNPSSLNRDGFSPSSSSSSRGGPLNMLRSNDGRSLSPTTGGYANSNSPYNPGSYGNSLNPPYNNANTTYPNTNPAGYPTIATNPNPSLLNPPSTNPAWQNSPGYAGSPVLSQLNNNAAYPPTTAPYANSNPSPYLSGQYPNLASRFGASSVPTNGGRYDEQLYDDPTLANKENKLLPFLLLFSIVGNVYLGLWMSHLRTRYRQLLGNLRGVPLSDLDN